jgi:alpha-L-fucosidase 2
LSQRIELNIRRGLRLSLPTGTMTFVFRQICSGGKNGWRCERNGTLERREFLWASLAATLSGAVGLVPHEVTGLVENIGDTTPPGANAMETASGLTLWYTRPAEQWLEALPIGNGRLAAMVYGGVPQETLQLNEGTLWAGGPHDYDSPEALAALPEIRRLVLSGDWHRAQDMVNSRFVGRPAGQMPYQTVGAIALTFPHHDPASDYRRELNLDTAVATTMYTANGVRYRREAFVSAVDQVIVLHLTADRTGQIDVTLGFSSPQKSEVAISGDATLALTGMGGDASGIAGQIRFQALARVQHHGGSLTAQGNQIVVTKADQVTILISIGTGYNDYRDVSGDAAQRAQGHLTTAAHKSFQQLRQDHIADYRRLFGRVNLHLGSTDAARDATSNLLPTDERVTRYHEGHDPQLAALHFQYGRYLLISCSRPGGQPATLQGLWNDSVSPPWGSKYTVNINTEMNYWPAAPTNLIECYVPLFQMLAELAQAGQRSAHQLYGARGWMCHHNTDAWRGTAPVDGAFWGMWPTGGAWLCRSLWDHYEFTHDRTALAAAYPILKGAAEFFLDTLIEEPEHHWLVTCPSISPENAHHPDASICAGPTMDMQILRDLFDAVIKSAEILQRDSEFRAQVQATRERLAPMQIGRQGQLQEWLHDWDALAPEQNHRHVSHLYGLFPSHQITQRGTPELFAAAHKSLETRGDLATGWSLAWKINLWARLEDGDRAHKLLGDLLTPERTAPNLFDLHPPFQIDGNFGAVSGVTEMLLQSHTGEIHLLPALPTAWSTGSVTGLRARGGAVVDLWWEHGKLTHTKLHANVDGTYALRYGELTLTLPAHAGKTVVLDGALHKQG